VPLSTRTAVALGMIALSAIGVATVFGNTILALVAPAAEVGTGAPATGGPTGPASPKGQPAGAATGSPRVSPTPVDTARNAAAAPIPEPPPPAGAKDASS
jgi:hypothetical protein